jgi:hypothetical protein
VSSVWTLDPIYFDGRLRPNAEEPVQSPNRDAILFPKEITSHENNSLNSIKRISVVCDKNEVPYPIFACFLP